MAKSADERAGTSGSQFFVVTGPEAAKLPADYALVGTVSGGEPAVQKIGAIITDPRTDLPDSPVVIKSIRVAEKSGNVSAGLAAGAPVYGPALTALSSTA